ncbi:MAG TPA: hypothetical protein VGQ17_08460 [Gemmatimonadales bacterium]|nr:hypothetical protein [Gemmatimonadales bacterium]
MSRRGIALLVAVAMLATLGAIAMTAYTLARAERQAGLGALAEVQAGAAAEAAATEALAGWPAARTPTLPGEEALLARVALPGPAEGWSVVRALGGPIFAIRAWGVRRHAGGAALAERRLALLVRLVSTPSGDSVRPRVEPHGWQAITP